MKVEVKEAQSNEVLQQGDYVTNLTKEQFEELIGIEGYSLVPLLYFDSAYLYFDIINNLEGLFTHDSGMLKTKFPFEEFKQRAINTFKDETN